MSDQTGIFLVTEDDLSHSVMFKIITEKAPHLVVERSLVTGGCGNIKNKVMQFNNACKYIPHVILTDLDAIVCPLKLMNDWNIRSNSELIFRIAIKEVESWLLADREGFAKFLDIPTNKLPQQPEECENPKRELINLSRNSKFGLEIAPQKGSRAIQGYNYNGCLVCYVQNNWSIDAAMEYSPSLERAVKSLISFKKSN